MDNADVKTIYVLAMSDRGQFQPKPNPPDELDIRRAEIPCAELNWFLHQAVGSDYRWGGRETWGAKEWRAYVNDSSLETWLAYVRGTPAGYFELKRHEDDSCQIVFFGLMGQFIGQGIGGHLLTYAIECAWRNANRVWLTTCSHDHQHALPNYQARGFQLVEQRVGEPNELRESALFGHG